MAATSGRRKSFPVASGECCRDPLGNRCRCDAAKVYHLGLIPDRAGFIGPHQRDQLRQQAFRDAGSRPRCHRPSGISMPRCRRIPKCVRRIFSGVRIGDEGDRSDMAEYGEWNRKGAVLSDVTAQKEYGVTRDFIVKGVQAGELEFREGAVWGNPYLRVLRSQLERYIVAQLGSEYLLSKKSHNELHNIRKEIAAIRKKLAVLEARKAALECAIKT
jgi:hypothetical protein